jgi:hypothetical protein
MALTICGRLLALVHVAKGDDKMADVSANYDPFAVIKMDRERSEEYKRRGDADEARRKQWDSGWNEFWKKPSRDSLLALGPLLREWKCGFWLELVECRLARTKFAVEKIRPPNCTLSPGFPFTVIALRLLKASYRGDAAFVADEFTRVEPDGQRLRNVHDACRELYSIVDHCLRDALYPATPLMTRSELANACRGHLTNFDKSGITKRLATGNLVINNRFGTGRGELCEFELPQGRNQDTRTMHIRMLECAVRQLRKCKETGFFSDPV